MNSLVAQKKKIERIRVSKSSSNIVFKPSIKVVFSFLEQLHTKIGVFLYGNNRNVCDKSTKFC